MIEVQSHIDKINAAIDVAMLENGKNHSLTYDFEDANPKTIKKVKETFEKAHYIFKKVKGSKYKIEKAEVSIPKIKSKKLGSVETSVNCEKPPETAPEIPFDQKKYDELMKSAKTIAGTHNLLSAGLYQGHQMNDLRNSLEFVESLHKEIMKELDPLIELKAQHEAKTIKPISGENHEQAH